VSVPSSVIVFGRGDGKVTESLARDWPALQQPSSKFGVQASGRPSDRALVHPDATNAPDPLRLAASPAEPGAVVDRPIVFEEADPEVFRDRYGTVAIDIGKEARRLGQKVARVEFEDAGKPGFASSRIDTHVAFLRDERARGGVELALDRVSRKGMARKPGTTHDHAVEGEMNPFFAQRPDHVILEMV